MNDTGRFSTFQLVVGIATIVACIAAVLVVPEIRQLLGLEPKPNPTIASPTTTPTLIIPKSEVDKVFPLFVGNSWSYMFGTMLESGDEQNPITKAVGSYTETIISIETGLSDKARIVNVSVTGENYMSECNWGELFSGEAEIWYIVDNTRIYQSCRRDEAYKIANSIIHDDVQSLAFFTPDYIMPLEVGKLWPAFSDLAPREDTAYQWFVEAKLDVNVPASQFKDCYRLLLFTLGDSTIRWVCPGTGLVAKEYHHSGAVVDYRAELMSSKTSP